MVECKINQGGDGFKILKCKRLIRIFISEILVSMFDKQKIIIDNMPICDFWFLVCRQNNNSSKIALKILATNGYQIAKERRVRPSITFSWREAFFAGCIVYELLVRGRNV